MEGTGELEKISKELIEEIDKFPKNKREEIIFDKWSLKDSVAHLAAWNLLRVKEIEALLRGEYIEKITNYDNFNEIEVNKRKDNPWDVIFLEFVDSCQMLANAFLKIPKDLENLRIWSDTDITPKTWLKMDINHMRGEHLAQLRRTK